MDQAETAAPSGMVIDWKVLMPLFTYKTVRQVWLRLVGSMNTDGLCYLDRNGLSRHTVSDGVRRLVGASVLRFVGSGHDTFYVNPLVIHPYWLKGHAYTDRVHAFDQGIWETGRLLNKRTTLEPKPVHKLKPEIPLG